MLLVSSECLSDTDIRMYFDELFDRPAVIRELTKWNEVYNREHVLNIVRHLESQDALTRFAMQDGRVVGNVLAFVAPSLYSLSKVAMEVSIGTVPTAPMSTLLTLHRTLAVWAREKDCRHIQVSGGPYTPAAYSRVLIKLGFIKLGGTYMRRV